MSYRTGKSILIGALAILCWMVLSAFQPDRSARSAPGAPTTLEIDLPAEDLALLEKAPTAPEASVAAVAPKEVAAPAKALPATTLPGPAMDPADHEQHRKAMTLMPEMPAKPRRKVDANAPLTADGHGRPMLDWDLLASTKVDKNFSPTFPRSLQEADGKSVVLSGFMSPLDEAGGMTVFLLLEYPSGCFYCQTPDPTGIVLIEIATGQETTMSYELVTVVGKLRLNSTDPEDFLYIVSNAQVALAQ